MGGSGSREGHDEGISRLVSVSLLCQRALILLSSMDRPIFLQGPADPNAAVVSKALAILNKLTPEKFEKLTEEFKNVRFRY